MGGGLEFEKHVRKKIEGLEPRLGRQKLIAAPLTPARKSKCAGEKKRIKPRLRIKGKVLKFRLACPIPIFQRGFEIAFKEIDRREEIIGVVVPSVDRERAAQFPFRSRKLLLAIRNSC